MAGNYLSLGPSGRRRGNYSSDSQADHSFRSVAGKRSNGRAVYLGDPRLALLGRSPVGVEKSRSRRLAQSPQVCVFLEVGYRKPVAKRRLFVLREKTTIICCKLNGLEITLPLVVQMLGLPLNGRVPSAMAIQPSRVESCPPRPRNLDLLKR